MTTKQESNLFDKERGQTNESLISERIKTDQSLVGNHEKAERSSDEKVRLARMVSDEARAQDRIEADINSINLSNVNNECHESSDNLLQEERLIEDDNVKKERNLVDSVIREERNQKEILLNGSLHKERAETDENLSREREHVDTEIKRSTDMLTTREEFLAIVSHDLRNPIGAVFSCSDHLLKEPSFEMSDDCRQWIKFIKRNAESSLRLIKDLLDMERFAHDKLTLVKAPHNLDELINDSIENFAHLAGENKITLTRTAPTLTLDIKCDRDRIEQVLSNLIGNALKFSAAGDSVIVEACQVNDEVQVSVSDTGPGIADEQKMKIFDRFAQIDNKDRQGLGLGLYISRMLIEAHQGKIWVTSTLGKGSTFFFALPHKM